MNLKRKRFLVLACCLAVITTIGACKTTKGGSNSTENHPEEKLGWKLGTQAFTFNRFTFFDAVAKTDSCNLSYIEAYPGQELGGGIPGKMDYNMDEDTRAKVLSLLKDRNVKMVAFGVVGADSEEEWIKIFEFSKAMGVETITSEPNEKDLQLLSDLCDKYQINLAIHNHPKPSQYWNPDIILNAIKGKSNRLGICADVGHWLRSGLDPVESLQKANGHVFQIHMKDLNTKNENSHDVHWGKGEINMDAVIKELKKQKFKGGISAEYEHNWENNRPDVAQSVANFRESFTKL